MKKDEFLLTWNGTKATIAAKPQPLQVIRVKFSLPFNSIQWLCSSDLTLFCVQGLVINQHYMIVMKTIIIHVIAASLKVFEKF